MKSASKKIAPLIISLGLLLSASVPSQAYRHPDSQGKFETVQRLQNPQIILHASTVFFICLQYLHTPSNNQLNKEAADELSGDKRDTIGIVYYLSAILSVHGLLVAYCVEAVLLKQIADLESGLPL